ncbi:UDP-galactose transporter [Diaporthe sp. PMI_573]|nr:UDP-galactose transporter [Diaporthaceae sp. PMI_573]
MCQNAASILLQHRLQTRQVDDSVQYKPLSAVVLSEGLKMLISLAIAAHGFLKSSTESCAEPGPSNFLGHVLAGHDNSAVPAFLYTLSATSQSLGAYNLDILPYLMLSQVKLILTPVFSRVLLKQTLQPHQWLCLVVMTTGLVLVQVGSAARSFGAPRADDAGKDMAFGIVAMMVAAFCSAFAGVYMEAVLKTSENSFMVRNAQLAAYTCLCSLGGLMWQSDLGFKGCFRGYTVLVWALVLLQAIGGFLVSWAVCIASTIAKNYAQSLGFLAALTIPLVASPHTLSAELYCGIALVLGGVFGSLWKRDAPLNPAEQGKAEVEKPRYSSMA